MRLMSPIRLTAILLGLTVTRVIVRSPRRCHVAKAGFRLPADLRPRTTSMRSLATPVREHTPTASVYLDPRIVCPQPKAANHCHAPASSHQGGHLAAMPAERSEPCLTTPAKVAMDTTSPSFGVDARPVSRTIAKVRHERPEQESVGSA